MAPDFFQQRAGSDGGLSAYRTVSDNQREAFPYLAKCLCGTAPSKGAVANPRYSLNLYATDHGIGWTLRAIGSGENWYGSAVEAADVLVAIDVLLQSGEAKRGRDKTPPGQANSGGDQG